MQGNITEAVATLIAMVEQQQFLEAIERFYAEDATMQENSTPPRIGLQALLDGERYALAHRLKDIHVCKAVSHVLSGDRAAINWVFEYTDYEGNRCRLDEIAYQLWKDGKIVEERFFYNPSEIRQGS
jgi:hypothetical protein